MINPISNNYFIIIIWYLEVNQFFVIKCSVENETRFDEGPKCGFHSGAKQ